AGYNIPRLAWLMAELPVDVIGRLKSSRVFCARPERPARPTRGRPALHGQPFSLNDPDSWGPAATTSTGVSPHYGAVEQHSWNRLHPRLTRRNNWKHHPGTLPIIEGTVIQLKVEHTRGATNPKPLWLWTNACDLTEAQADK